MSTELYHIVKAPDAVLKQTAQEVQNVTDDLRTQIERMFATMYDAPGIGLAANQVNLLNRVIVMDVPDGYWHYDGEDKNGVLQIKSGYSSGDGHEDEPPEPKKNPIAMINPEIIWQSDQRSVFEEGCLSLPGQHGIVERPAKVRVKYLDYEGTTQETDAEGLFSHCVQHEIDHLNGVLFIDYLSSLKRNMIIRKMEKAKKQGVL
jgi:peptide deformylase